MRSVRIVVRGRVQGVGFRAWVAARAGRHGLSGWVRNRRDGSVEAVISGADGDVEAMLAACRHGPAPAVVTDLDMRDEPGPPEPGFHVRSTV